MKDKTEKDRFLFSLTKLDGFLEGAKADDNIKFLFGEIKRILLCNVEFLGEYEHIKELKDSIERLQSERSRIKNEIDKMIVEKNKLNYEIGYLEIVRDENPNV